MISNNQAIFLLRRQLVDGVVIVNEVINFAKRRNDTCLLLKVDFKKVCDSAN